MFLLGGFPCPKVFAGFVGSARAPAEPDFGYRKARAKIQQKKIKCSPGVSEFCFLVFYPVLAWRPENYPSLLLQNMFLLYIVF